MTYRKIDYEDLAASLETSEQILYAIEEIAGGAFERNDEGELKENTPFKIWNAPTSADRAKTLAFLPSNDSENGEEIFWGDDGKFAEFDGDEWIQY